ncbi:MAG: hypothetical protein AMXMBFR36_08150 [Acidobacteriota bacterium]
MKTLCLSLLLLAPAAAVAADGDLDPSFGFFGITLVETDLFDAAADVAADADGRIIVAFSASDSALGLYRVGLARFTPAGALDATFDGDGVRVIDLAVDGMDGGSPCAVQVLADGRILVAGAAFDAADAPAGMLLRLLANGQLDPSFDGDGILFFAPGGEEHRFHDLGIAATGQIVVSGNRYPAGNDRRTTVVRFTPAGVFESYFETNLFPASSEYAPSLVVETATRQVVAARGNDSNPVTRVLRVVDGAPDPTFGGDGVVDILGPEGPAMVRVARTGNGRYVVASDYDSSATLTWLLADGSVDPATCTVTPFCTYSNLAGLRDLVLQSDGSALAVGWIDTGSSDDFQVGRLLSTGAVDGSFGSAGFRAIDCAPGSATTTDYGSAIALSSGRAVVIGRRSNSPNPEAVCVARLQASLIFRNGFEGGNVSGWALP